MKIREKIISNRYNEKTGKTDLHVIEYHLTFRSKNQGPLVMFYTLDLHREENIIGGSCLLVTPF
jgi:hypothetical protein